MKREKYQVIPVYMGFFVIFFVLRVMSARSAGHIFKHKIVFVTKLSKMLKRSHGFKCAS